jgi:type IV secretory pathway TrbF-like protein
MKPGSTPILAAISTLPVIVACALLAATEARASTCRDDPNGCDPYVVTIDQVGNNSVCSAGAGSAIEREFVTGGLTNLVSTVAPISDDDDIVQHCVAGRSVRAIAKARRTSEVNVAIDRRAGQVTTDKARKHGLALELARLDELQEVFYERALEG